MAGRASSEHQPAEAAKIRPDAYNTVVASAQLLTIQLSSSIFEAKPEYYDPSVERVLSHDHMALGARYDKDNNAVFGYFKFICAAKRGNRYLLKAVAEYVVIYDVAEGVDPEAAEAFCNRVGIYAAYPYYRALVAHHAWAAGARLPPLPVIATRGAPIRATTPATNGDET